MATKTALLVSENFSFDVRETAPKRRRSRLTEEDRRKRFAIRSMESDFSGVLSPSGVGERDGGYSFDVAPRESTMTLPGPIGPVEDPIEELEVGQSTLAVHEDVRYVITRTA
jgi:hypothetical protein